MTDLKIRHYNAAARTYYRCDRGVGQWFKGTEIGQDPGLSCDSEDCSGSILFGRNRRHRHNRLIRFVCRGCGSSGQDGL